MPVDLKMPQLGESVVEGTIGKWLKKAGDPVQEFEPLLEVVTDKVDTEIPSPVTGVLLEIRAQEGQTVKVGTVIAVLNESGEAEVEQTTPRQVEEGDVPAANRPRSESAQTESGRPVGRRYLTPVVARIAAEHEVDLSLVEGSGRHGRITKKDLLAYLDARPEARAKVDPSSPTRVAEPAPQAKPALDSSQHRPPDMAAIDEAVPLSKMRQAIVRHMRQSKDTAAHVTTFWEIDLSRVVSYRAEHKAQFSKEGIKLTYTPFFVEAIVAGLKAFPMLNAVLAQDRLIYKRRIHIGMAVDLGEEGLIVPIIRDADEKNLRGLARSVNDLAERARAGSLAPDDVQGGTFSVTNHGVLGSLAGTPIIPMPQVGILGVGAIQKRPVVIESELGDAIAIRPMAYTSLSFDHRVIDGATADRFMAVVRAYLQDYGT